MGPEVSIPCSQALPLFLLILSQINSVYALPFNLFTIHFNITLPHMPRHSMRPLSFKVPPLKPWMCFCSPRTCCMPRPSYPTECDHPRNIWWAVQIMKLLIMQFSPVSCYTLHTLYTLLDRSVSILRLQQQWNSSSIKGVITDNPMFEASLCVSTCSNGGHHMPAVLDPPINANFSTVINKLFINICGLELQNSATFASFCALCLVK